MYINSIYRRLRRKVVNHPYCSLIVFIFVFIFITTIRLHHFRDFIYLLRPLYDTKIQFVEIPHYYDARLNDDHKLCSLHNWTLRSKEMGTPKVIDAILFSVEIDLLEIRLKELWPIVDYFIILESNRTFTGDSKQLILKNNIERFAWAKEKLHVYAYNELYQLKFNESPFSNEMRMRNHLTELVRQFATPNDLIIVADVDEIPRRSTIELLRKCIGFPPIIHLALKTYFFSFEFFFSVDDSWRAKVVTFTNNFFYSHNKQSEYKLADAGWHCTFCFRYIKDFIFKMTSYSHNDRLMHRNFLLENREIQRRICLGLDPFDMYPEMFTFRELLSKIGPIPKTNSYIDMPLELLTNGHLYPYLLKGNCLRQDFIGVPDW